MQVGDFVKGLPSSDSYIINEDMTKGVVTEVNDDNIKVKIINHERGCTGVFSVRAKNIEIIGHIKKFNKTEVLDLLASGCKKAILDYDLTGADLTNANLRDADLRGANLTGADLTSANLRDADLRDADLRGADLRGADLTGADLTSANLRGADLRGTDIDFSCYPLWCGSLGLKADKRLACQLAYHLCSMQCDDAEYIKMRNSILGFANKFHRVDECGELKPIKEEVA